MLKKADIALFISLLLFAVLFIFIFDFTNINGGSVAVSLEGMRYGSYPLDKDTIIDIKSKEGIYLNSLEIKNSKARMIHASCPDGYCIKQGEISHSHDTIVCLPNKIIVEVINGSKNKVDAVSQ